MKQYKSHKIVEAGRIIGIRRNCGAGNFDRLLDLDGGECIGVSLDYMTKHKPVEGGYFVKYEDGYESFSPAGAFVSGYTEIGQDQEQQAQLTNSGCFDEKLADRLANDFTYHVPKPGDEEVFKAIRMTLWNTAATLNRLVPNSREKSIALTKLEEAMFFANAGVARERGPF